MRRDQRHLRSGGAAVLNIVSLIDVFAILVFYLLVNALTVETLPVPSVLKLPDSEARAAPTAALAISISEQEIRLDGRLVGRVDDPQAARQLQAALQAAAPGVDAEINIVADKRLPFRVLKAVMSACTEARYPHVSLAVIEKAAARPAGGA
ncbi:MAG: biopolymer transporter ExbD [Xanthomonadaceae bacterium]|nr:biopolymer transporter ExbD [Xanthomonadaceae bacterium]